MNQSLIIPEQLAENLVSSKAYASDTIHETYKWLRQNLPIGKVIIDGIDPFWVITKHADVQLISRNNDLFRNAERSTVLTTQANLELNKAITGGSVHVIESLVQTDGNTHSVLRNITENYFRINKVNERANSINSIAKKSVEKMQQLNGQCDFVADVALHYPLEVIMQILGLPESEYELMLAMTQQLFGPQDPDNSPLASFPPEEIPKLVNQMIGQYNEYFWKVGEDRRKNPKDDLASIISNSIVDGKPISKRHEAGYYFIVATAGHDTTSSATAQAMWALATVDGLLNEVKNNLSLIPKLVEEAVRFATPVKTFMRSTNANTNVAGVDMAKNDWMMLCYASANRDEDMFENPYQFDIHRASNRRHLAFGNGGHVCIGQHLARLEISELFKELLPKLNSVEIDGEVKLIQSTFVNGLKNLPIKFQFS